MKRDLDEVLIYGALSRVETPEYDIEAAVAARRAVRRKKVPLRPVRRLAVLAAVCAALALAVGAAAVAGISGAWGYFFPWLPQSAVAPVGVSQTSGDYTLTLEDAVVDGNGAMLLLALSRADGAPIEPEAHLRTNSMDVKLLADGASFGGSSGFTGGGQLSDDGKTLYLCYEAENSGLRGGERLLGKTLTFTARGVAVQLRERDCYYCIRGGTPLDLAPLAALDIPDLSDLELRRDDTMEQAVNAALDQDISLPLPAVERDFPQYALRGCIVTEDGLSFVLTGGTDRSGDLVCTGAYADVLVDTRDGTRYDLTTSRGRTLPDGLQVSLYSFQDCPLGRSDLPYLQLEVAYPMDRVLSEAPFSLSFPADRSTAVAIPLDGVLHLAGTELHPSELRLSALGLSVSFADSMDDAGILYTEGTAPLVHLADGTDLVTAWQGGYGGGDGTCSVRFGAKDPEGERIFFDPEQIRSVSFGNLEIPVP